jgi:hypothetical protein
MRFGRRKMAAVDEQIRWREEFESRAACREWILRWRGGSLCCLGLLGVCVEEERSLEGM